MVSSPLSKFWLARSRWLTLPLTMTRRSSSNISNVGEVSSFRITRTTRYGVRLIPLSLIDRFQIVGQLPLNSYYPPRGSHLPRGTGLESHQTMLKQPKDRYSKMGVLLNGPQPIPGKRRRALRTGLMVAECNGEARPCSRCHAPRDCIRGLRR
jgi:hypothetical protein